MGFPEINTYPKCQPGPYEQQMGGYLVSLLAVFAGHVPDLESHAWVTQLVSTPAHWSAGHAVFDEIRNRMLLAIQLGDSLGQAQYWFEESCCQAVYNATHPPDPFDPSSAFFVLVHALGLAQLVGVELQSLAQVFVPPGGSH